MTDTTQATPRPWERGTWGATPIFSGFHQGCYIKKDEKIIGFVTAIDDEVGEANATLIVRAVNCHEELVERLQVYHIVFGDHLSDEQNKETEALLKKARGE